jgi:L-histidine Nalpha-methyltransferase
MSTAPARARFTLIAPRSATSLATFARDVRRGLTASRKWLPCWYFYDEKGSLLFEEICKLPEYYLTRAEREILESRAGELAARFNQAIDLIELGSGNAAKTRLLIDALLRRQGTLRFIPIDICKEALEESSRGLLEDFPALEIVAVAAEYQDALSYLRREPTQGKLLLWLGSNIGNFDRDEASAFLRQVGGTLSAADCLLIGIDLRKDAGVLERAYADSRGVTAAFNLNLLARINRELEGNFDLEAFQHQALYNQERGRIEMYLISRKTQRVQINALQLEVSLSSGEAIHTENSYKYSFAEIDTLADAARLSIEAQWLDSQRRFSVNLMKPVQE